MLEEQCRTVFKTACEEAIERMEEQRLAIPRWKGRPKNEFAEFLSWDSGFHVWDGWLVKKVMNTRVGHPMRMAFNYFVHSERLRDAYIRKKYGTIENAMRQTGSFEKLFDTFKEDFAERRNRFLMETEMTLDIKRGELKRQGKMPHSHGGVANLLKVLTDTMKAQGSSIRTIAKVQYSVCMQAGILIPDEFITDVLVSANMEDE